MFYWKSVRKSIKTFCDLIIEKSKILVFETLDDRDTLCCWSAVTGRSRTHQVHRDQIYVLYTLAHMCTIIYQSCVVCPVRVCRVIDVYNTSSFSHEIVSQRVFTFTRPSHAVTRPHAIYNDIYKTSTSFPPQNHLFHRVSPLSRACSPTATVLRCNAYTNTRTHVYKMYIIRVVRAASSS